MIRDVEQKYLGLSKVIILVKCAKKQIASKAFITIKEQWAAWVSAKEQDYT